MNNVLKWLGVVVVCSYGLWVMNSGEYEGLEQMKMMGFFILGLLVLAFATDEMGIRSFASLGDLKGYDIERMKNCTPLMKAAYAGKLSKVRKILEKDNIELSQRDPDGMSALHWAVEGEKLDTADLLLDMGAKVNQTDKEGYTPLHLAMMVGMTEISKLLLERGADIRKLTNERETCLGLASEFAALECIRLALDKGENVNEKDGDGETPLMLATEAGLMDVIEFLIERGADVNAKDNEGKTAADHAENYDEPEIAKKLRSLG